MLTTFKTSLTSKVQLNSNTYLYHFDLLEPKEIIFEPGQYVMLKVPSPKGPVSRLYSIASPNTIKNRFELIIGIIPGGLASNYLFSLKENTEVIFYGPAGVFGLKENERSKIFMVTGTGIAPARSILISNMKDQISKMQMKNQKYHLFWGLKNYKDVYLLNELKQFSNLTICLSREQNLDTIPKPDRKYFKLGHIDKVMEEELNNEAMKQLNNFEWYLCGGRLIVESLKQFLLSNNVPQDNIYFEKF